MVARVTLLDTYPRFTRFWESAWPDSIGTQINRWVSEYLAPYPELLEKQQLCYSGEGEDWRRIASEIVFPCIPDRLHAMEIAHDSIIGTYERVSSDVAYVLDFEEEVALVVYVGIGCGAGWATKYNGTPAILLGLESMAECGWIEPYKVEGLIAHELGHLVHSKLRDDNGVADSSGPWWQLYCEGFAQICEQLVTGSESWHMRDGTGNEDWLTWCGENRAWLAQEFLRAVDAGESVRPFFGSWYEIEGRSQTGYYLGRELINCLRALLSLHDIALLQPDDSRLKETLLRIENG